MEYLSEYKAQPTKRRKTESVLQILISGEEKRKSEEVRKNREYMKKVIECLYFMIKERWAVSENLEDLVRFVSDLGVEELASHLDCPDSVNYLSSNTVTDMINAISQSNELELISSLKDAKYFTLLADESTDEGNRTQFANGFMRVKCQNTIWA